jgi:hypothetical protein
MYISVVAVEGLVRRTPMGSSSACIGMPVAAAQRSSMAWMIGSSLGEGKWMVIVRPLLAALMARPLSQETAGVAAGVKIAAASASSAPQRLKSSRCAVSDAERKLGYSTSRGSRSLATRAPWRHLGRSGTDFGRSGSDLGRSGSNLGRSGPILIRRCARTEPAESAVIESCGMSTDGCAEESACCGTVAAGAGGVGASPEITCVVLSCGGVRRHSLNGPDDSTSECVAAGTSPAR